MLSLKFKLIVAFVGVGLVPLTLVSFVNYRNTEKGMTEFGIQTLESVAREKSQAVIQYFEDESLALTDLADSEMTIHALEEFSVPFEKSNVSAEWVNQNKSTVLKYYEEQFGKVYYEQSKNKFDLSLIRKKIDGLTMAAQKDFIVDNENPIGKKDALLNAKRSSPYAQAHSRFHAFFRGYIQRHSLYDLFLVAPNGRVVYTVFKETDFATSLVSGPWSQTGLAKAFEASKKLKPAQVHIEDFAAYTPSYEAPASFAATPIFKDGKYVGSLIVQLPLDKISSIAGKRDGLGNAGQTILLGSDGRLRADTFRTKDTHNVAASFREESDLKFDFEAAMAAKTGKSGVIKGVSYDGVKTLAYYMPINIKNLTWYAVIELAQDELFAGLNNIVYVAFGLGICGFILIGGLGSYIGGSVSKSISEIASHLAKSADSVSSASIQMANSSRELSLATTSQASSLEETATSLEEITSMIVKSSDNAEVTSRSSAESHSKAEEGRAAVNQVLTSMDEISQSNDAILNEVKESNQQMLEIVKVVQDIGNRTKVINEIVFQTKLLSFNASVEAARAGEHGKGFSVVAEEVGNLAQMSGSAAKEITEILDSSIHRVDGIVKNTQMRVEMLVQNGREKVESGIAVAKQCSDVLTEIVQNVSRVSGLSQEIFQASKEQSQGVSEINKAMSQLDSVTQKNAATSEEAASAAEQMSKEAELLKESVSILMEVVSGQKPK